MAFDKAEFLKRRRAAELPQQERSLGGPTKSGALRRVLGGGWGANFIGAARMSRLEASWSTVPHTADAYVYQHWTTLVARSRMGCEDYDHLRKFVSLIKDNVPGPLGFRCIPLPVDPGGTVDRVAARAILQAYKQWSKRENYDFEGRLTRQDGERLAAVTAAKDGEAIGLIHTGANSGPFGFSIEMVDPMLLNPREYQKLTNGNVVRHGIEFPAEGGRPVAYHFMEQDEQRMGYYVSSMQNKRVEASRVIHWFVPEIVGQKRGLPWTRTALWRLRMLSGGEDAALTNFRVTASKQGFFKSQGEDDDVDADELPMDAEPGSFENIGDREFVQWSPQFPDAAVEPFIRTMLRSVATGLLSSYHSLSGDLTSVSFSSIRQGTLDERSVWLGLQECMEAGWCMPVFIAWLQYALPAGKITLSNGRPLPFEKFDKYRDAAFAGRRWTWIDPSSEANAAQIMLGQKLKSRSEIIREIGDRDPEEVWDEIEAEDKELRARKIVPLVPPGATPVEPPEAAGSSEKGGVETPTGKK